MYFVRVAARSIEIAIEQYIKLSGKDSMEGRRTRYRESADGTRRWFARYERQFLWLTAKGRFRFELLDERLPIRVEHD